MVVDTGRQTPWETSPFERSESGTTTRLRIDLGSDAAPVATVRLRTDKEVFVARSGCWWIAAW